MTAFKMDDGSMEGTQRRSMCNAEECDTSGLQCAIERQLTVCAHLSLHASTSACTSKHDSTYYANDARPQHLSTSD